MKKKSMKTLAGLCALSIIMSGMSMPVYGSNDVPVSFVVTAEEAVPTEGTCGENLT